jgi:putative transposase
MADSPKRLPYQTDMTDEEWALYQEVFPEHCGYPGLTPVKYSVREILNAIRYKEKTGCQWANLPHDFPPWKHVSRYFYPWKKEGRFERFRQLVVKKTRVAEGRHETPTAGAMDSKSVPIASTKGPRGIDGNKKIKGHKRHILVDVLGLILVVLITPANVADSVAGACLLLTARRLYPTLTLVWADGTYKGKKLDEARAETGIGVEIKEKPEGQRGFVPIRKRWVVERTFGWQMWSRQLSKGYDHTESSLAAWTDIAMSELCLRRLFRRSATFAS